MRISGAESTRCSTDSRGVRWVKAHLTLRGAKSRGIPEEHWHLNAQADIAATAGLDMHEEDPGYWALYRYRGQAVRRWQLHLLSIYRKLRQCKACAEPAAPGLASRIRSEGPRPQPRTVRTEIHLLGKHKVVHHPRVRLVKIVVEPPGRAGRDSFSSGEGHASPFSPTGPFGKRPHPSVGRRVDLFALLSPKGSARQESLCE